MRKSFTLTAAILMFTILAFGSAMAANRSGQCDGTGPIHDITAGTPFDVTGTVITMVPGEGMVIATADGNVTIYGIGPVRYWNLQDVDRPMVGDTVSATGYVIDYNGVERAIAVEIVIDGETVQLRDADGYPLWKKVRPNARLRR